MAEGPEKGRVEGISEPFGGSVAGGWENSVDGSFPKSLKSEKEVLGGLWGLLLEIADETEASEESSEMEGAA